MVTCPECKGEGVIHTRTISPSAIGRTDDKGQFAVDAVHTCSVCHGMKTLHLVQLGVYLARGGAPKPKMQRL